MSPDNEEALEQKWFIGRFGVMCMGSGFLELAETGIGASDSPCDSHQKTQLSDVIPAPAANIAG